MVELPDILDGARDESEMDAGASVGRSA